MKQDFEIIHEQLVRAYKHVTPFYDYSDDDELLLKKSQIYNEMKKLIEALTMISYQIHINVKRISACQNFVS